jgi:hypothetical protein
MTKLAKLVGNINGGNNLHERILKKMLYFLKKECM